MTIQNIHTLKLELPYITQDIPGIQGRIKSKPEDFIVTEIPAYEPVGYGSHLYINITKKMQTTREIQLKLSEIFEQNPDQIGKAGLKDKNAVTTQTFSVPINHENNNITNLIPIIEERINAKVNWMKKHTNKLRAGHLLGNFFEITIRDPEINGLELRNTVNEITSLIQSYGVPNYYGTQRIGEHGENVLSGLSILKGKKRINDRWLRRFLISSFQSYLCNRYLVKRIEQRLFDKLVQGDIAKKHETGGLFIVEDSIKETLRYKNKEISFTAPIYGYKMKKPSHDSAQLEEGILEQFDITFHELRKNRIKGTRRLGRLIPNINVKIEEPDVKLSFSLPKGGYATTVLREYLKTDVYLGDTENYITET